MLHVEHEYLGHLFSILRRPGCWKGEQEGVRAVLRLTSCLSLPEVEGFPRRGIFSVGPEKVLEELVSLDAICPPYSLLKDTPIKG